MPSSFLKDRGKSAVFYFARIFYSGILPEFAREFVRFCNGVLHEFARIFRLNFLPESPRRAKRAASGFGGLEAAFLPISANYTIIEPRN